MSAMAHLLTNTTSFAEQDYHAMVHTEELELGKNCAYPDRNLLNIGLDHKLLRPIGVYHFETNSNKIKHIKIMNNVDEFSKTIVNPLTKYGDIMYVHFVGNKVEVYPFIQKCFLIYVRDFDENDKSMFEDDLSKYFSLHFLYSAIDMAVAGFKTEAIISEKM